MFKERCERLKKRGRTILLAENDLNYRLQTLGTRGFTQRAFLAWAPKADKKAHSSGTRGTFTVRHPKVCLRLLSCISFIQSEFQEYLPGNQLKQVHVRPCNGFLEGIPEFWLDSPSQSHFCVTAISVQTWNLMNRSNEKVSCWGLKHSLSLFANFRGFSSPLLRCQQIWICSIQWEFPLDLAIVYCKSHAISMSMDSSPILAWSLLLMPRHRVWLTESFSKREEN